MSKNSDMLTQTPSRIFHAPVFWDGQQNITDKLRLGQRSFGRATDTRDV